MIVWTLMIYKEWWNTYWYWFDIGSGTMLLSYCMRQNNTRQCMNCRSHGDKFEIIGMMIIWGPKRLTNKCNKWNQKVGGILISREISFFLPDYMSTRYITRSILADFDTGYLNDTQWEQPCFHGCINQYQFQYTEFQRQWIRSCLWEIALSYKLLWNSMTYQPVLPKQI